MQELFIFKYLGSRSLFLAPLKACPNISSPYLPPTLQSLLKSAHQHSKVGPRKIIVRDYDQTTKEKGVRQQK